MMTSIDCTTEAVETAEPVKIAEAVKTAERASEIFVVDDNEDFREILSMILELEGHRVTGFADGASFLNEATTRTPICIFLDVVMPGLSGLDVLKKLKERRCAAPVFLISGHGDAPLMVEAIKNGAADFIEKPFDPYTAVLRVRDALEIRERRAETRASSAAHSLLAGDSRLTRRQCEVMALILAGASNEDVATSLGITARAAANHRWRIMKKLGRKKPADGAS
jgi:FixJ family two-component response regulator